MPGSTKSPRLLSLDVFRGATVAAMMVVNNPGDWNHVYGPLLHAPWHGWTFTDVIFPFFLWIVGLAMTLSFAKRLERGEDARKLTRHIVLRALAIMGIGLFMSGFPRFDLESWRIPGVLQRIGLCYLVAGFIVLKWRWRGQLAWTIGLLGVYWALVTLVPVPGYGAGVLEPTGSFVWYVDSTLLVGHTWSGAPAPGFDPEGIVSTIPAIATVLFGALSGRLLRQGGTDAERTVRLFLVGNVLLWLGVTMDRLLPINKNLWTSSYALFMSGLATVVFAACYWLIDLRGFRRVTGFFSIYGKNALTVFFLSGIVGKLLAMTGAQRPLYRTLFEPLGSPKNTSLLYALGFMLLLYGVAWFMHRRRWIVKV